MDRISLSKKVSIFQGIGEKVLDVIWADVSLITDGAGVKMSQEDDTTSQYWRFVEP